MRRISFFIAWNSGWIAVLGTLLGLVCAYYTVQLYKNLRTNFEELLPTNARSVRDLNEVTHRLESIDNLAILVFSENSEKSEQFVRDLAMRLQDLPKELVSSVEFRIEHEIEFFKRRQALFMSLSDLEKVRDYISARLEYERQLYNPLNIFTEREIPEPTLDFLSLKNKYAHRLGAYQKFPKGFYATPDGKIRAILVYMRGKSADIDQVIRLKNSVTQIIKDLHPAAYSPDIAVRYTGGIQDTLEEHDALVADLELSTLIVVIVISFAMLVFFKSIRATLSLIFSLFIGTFWTFGLSYFLVGYLNANSAFLGSIVIGNGINFGIILLARYLEERRRGRSNPSAVGRAATKTFPATWTAAGAAGLSYGSLMLTSFRGFNQFGVIGLIGMCLCWLSSYLLMPAYLTLFDRLKPLIPHGKASDRYSLAAWVAKAVGAAPALIWGVAFLITVTSIAMFSRYSPKILETDLSKLRNKQSIESGSAHLSMYLDQIFQRYLSPLVILPKDKSDEQKIAAKLRAEKTAEGKSSLIASIETIEDFIPENQWEKIQVLKQIQKLLPKRIMQRLSPPDQKLIEEFLTPEAFKAIRVSDLPKLVIDKFTEKDGSIGKMVLVEPPLTHETWEGENLIHFIAQLRNAADSVSPGTPVAGTIAITSDMIEAISHDGPRATLFALSAVVLLVIFLFRNIKTISLILFALFLGIIWMAGAVLGFWIKINFLNFIALPITFGIGVDYGANIFQRYREEGGRGILRVIRHTGGAVALCSFTTIVGYCSLLIASNRGFVSFGLLAVLGEVTCIVAAVIALPAFLILANRKSVA